MVTLWLSSALEASNAECCKAASALTLSSMFFFWRRRRAAELDIFFIHHGQHNSSVITMNHLRRLTAPPSTFSFSSSFTFTFSFSSLFFFSFFYQNMSIRLHYRSRIEVTFLRGQSLARCGPPQIGHLRPEAATWW